MCLRHQSDSPWLLALISVARFPAPASLGQNITHLRFLRVPGRVLPALIILPLLTTNTANDAVAKIFILPQHSKRTFLHESLTKLKERRENAAGELIITNWIMAVKRYGT